MIDRLTTCLLHPRFIGKFIIDKTSKIVILLLSMIIICAGILLGLAFKETNLAGIDERMIYNEVNNNVDVSLDNGKLEGSGGRAVYSIFTFDFLPTSLNLDNEINVVFNTDTVNIYYQNLLSKSLTYSELGSSSFRLGPSSSNIDQMYFTSLIRAVFGEVKPYLAFGVFLADMIDLIVNPIVIILVIYLLGMGVNQGVSGIFRFRLILHCMVSYFFVYFLAICFNLEFLVYIALVLPVIYFLLSIRNIVKIERRSM